MAGVNFDQFCGATLSMSLVCKEDDGDAFNLTGYTARGQVRDKPGGSTLVLNLSPTIPTPANGTIVISVSDESTAAVAPGIYSWDVVLDTPAGGVIYITGGTVKFRAICSKAS
jgi:hypothetical protein